MVEEAERPAEPPHDAGQAGPSGRKREREKGGPGGRAAKFRRGQAVATHAIPDKKLKAKMRYSERLASEAAHMAAKTDEWLLPSEPGALEVEGMERTWQIQQAALVREAEEGAGRKAFDLALPALGPYALDFTRNGRFLLLGGRRGHIALLDWQRAKLLCEVQVRETLRDVQFLHNDQFFAAAQKKYMYIYDKRGIEVHCLKEHIAARRLDFLPYHFLLTSIGEAGVLWYQDTSTGRIVAQHRTRLGACDVMRHNPWNAVQCLGHVNGTVTMWTPNITTPVVKLLCHKGPVRALAVDLSGRHLVTAGADGQVRVWDVRMYKPRHAYFSHAPVEALDISQRGLLALGHGHTVQVWQDALAEKQQSPYMRQTLASSGLRGLRFCPYEDVLGAGHAGGLSTLLVPGAGEPNYDSRVADPFQTAKARREQEVHALLDKLQPDMIVLDPDSIGQVRKEPAEARAAAAAEAQAANAARRAAAADKADAKKRMKGKNKPSRRAARKKANIIEETKGPMRARVARALPHLQIT
ncbi:hypothetical protein WJX81_004686 [Elliptochloris bilobata]|uniref:BING4 C-terminal domain-containing protein n=1 Tax=Elliptochloris bilobata TaxID=381761 RepID=A0AAW1QL75_9CHLO